MFKNGQMTGESAADFYQRNAILSNSHQSRQFLESLWPDTLIHI